MLLDIARGSILDGLGMKSVPAKENHLAWLRQQAATFVTVTKDGALRGCVGSLAATRPVGEDVASNARAAAFGDPRFPKLTREEWPRCRVEVSLLSAPKPLMFGDEAELLALIRPGEDGLILESDGKRATFLPQVWEGLPDKRQFLGELVKKAGLPPETRLAGCKVWRYRVRKFT